MRRPCPRASAPAAALNVEQGDTVPAQGQVVGEFAADQAGADDQHVFRPRDCCLAEHGAQLQVGAQVVDAPAQRCRQGGGQRGLRAVGQHQLVVA